MVRYLFLNLFIAIPLRNLFRYNGNLRETVETYLGVVYSYDPLNTFQGKCFLEPRANS